MFFIAAAGNGDNDEFPSYPASYALPHVISVTDTDHNDNLAGGWGKKSVDLAAPGINIWSTDKGDGYKSLSGASMATAHVNGTVALMLALVKDKGFNVTPRQIRNHLFDTVDIIPALVGQVATDGRLNANGALNPATAAAPDWHCKKSQSVAEFT